jgi:predicted Zn-dependent protease
MQGGTSCQKDDGKPQDPWWEIADEAAREKDPERLIELAKELERALDERDEQLQKKRSA